MKRSLVLLILALWAGLAVGPDAIPALADDGEDRDISAQVWLKSKKQSFGYTITNYTGYDIVVYHDSCHPSDWIGSSPCDNKELNNKAIPSRTTITQTLTAAPYRFDAGWADIRLDVYRAGSTGPVVFTSSYKDVGIARLTNGSVNKRYLSELKDGSPNLRAVWVRATGGPESFLNVYENSYGPRDWMAGLQDVLSLGDLSVPGSHDSGSYSSSRACECQSNSPVQQLYLGVRAFDFRIGNSCNELFFFHGPCNFNYEYWIRDTLLGFRDFLRDHPSEVIIIHMMRERKPDCPLCSWLNPFRPKDLCKNLTETGLLLGELLQEMEHEGLEIMKDYDQFPTLGEARGKVLIWYDPNVKACCTYPVELNWNGETKRQEVPWGRGTARFIVQDAYKNTAKAKWDIVRPLLDEAGQHTDGQTLYYNYTSCYTGIPNPAAGAADINEWLAAWLSRNPDKVGLGCLFADYITCAGFGGIGKTQFCDNGGYDLLPLMIYGTNPPNH